MPEVREVTLRIGACGIRIGFELVLTKEEEGAAVFVVRECIIPRNVQSSG